MQKEIIHKVKQKAHSILHGIRTAAWSQIPREGHPKLQVASKLDSNSYCTFYCLLSQRDILPIKLLCHCFYLLPHRCMLVSLIRKTSSIQMWASTAICLIPYSAREKKGIVPPPVLRDLLSLAVPLWMRHPLPQAAVSISYDNSGTIKNIL